MNNDELVGTISAITFGLESAFVHLGNVLEQRGVISRSELADSFEKTAINMPPDLKGREHTMMVLRHIAVGLRDSGRAEPPKLVP